MILQRRHNNGRSGNSHIEIHPDKTFSVQCFNRNICYCDDSAFGFSLAAHYTNKNAERTQQATDFLTEYSHKEPVIALPEEDSLYINGDTVEVIGSRPYYVFNQGNRMQFEPNVKYKTDEFIRTVTAV